MFAHMYNDRTALRRHAGMFLGPKLANGMFGNNDNPWVDQGGNPSWGEGETLHVRGTISLGMWKLSLHHLQTRVVDDACSLPNHA